MSFEEFNKFVKENPDFQKKIVQMLQDAKKSLEDEINRLNDAAEESATKVAARFIQGILNKNVKDICVPLRLAIYSYDNTINLICRPRLAIVELLISKLSQPQFEFSPDDQGFLIRLFLASKLSSPELMTSELEQCMKNLKLMFDTIALTLFRYYRIHQYCPEAFVRSYLCSIEKEELFYERTISGSFFTFDVKSEKEKKYDDVRKELFDLAKTFCLETYTMFNQQLSTFGFDKLKTDFQSDVSKFSERVGCGNRIYDIAFNRDLFKSDFINDLLVSFLTFESKFIEEKQKLQDFSNQFAASLKEIIEKIKPIINSHREYETTDFGHADHQPTPRSSYTEPFEELRDLAALLNAVLENKCQQNCDCKRNFYGTGRRQPPPDEIVHKPVVMTPEEIEQVGRFVASFSEELLK